MTGGTDALINFWHDSTAADKQEAFLREVSQICFGSQICLVLHDSNIFFLSMHPVSQCIFLFTNAIRRHSIKYFYVCFCKIFSVLKHSLIEM